MKKKNAPDKWQELISDQPHMNRLFILLGYAAPLNTNNWHKMNVVKTNRTSLRKRFRSGVHSSDELGPSPDISVINWAHVTPVAGDDSRDTFVALVALVLCDLK